MNDERERLTSLLLGASRSLLDLGVDPETITLRGEGFSVTIRRGERCGDCVHQSKCKWDANDDACPDFERING